MSVGLLFLAVEGSQLDTAARLLEDDDSLVRARNAAGHTPLHVATARALLPIIDLLLAYGADVNATADAAFGGLAPLHVAARYDHTYAGQTLVRAGANPNLRSAGGSTTPLHQCAQFGSAAFAAWLLSIPGVDALATDAAGFSAHAYAKKLGFLTLARQLPSVKMDVMKQLESEPHYAHNLAAVKDTLDKKAKLAAKKAEALEKKKKRKLW